MYGQLIEQAEKYLRSLYSQDNVAAQLKRLLAELLAAGEANADAACRRLQLSRRTLQRRLRAEKTSFQKILNEVRAVLAVRLNLRVAVFLARRVLASARFAASRLAAGRAVLLLRFLAASVLASKRPLPRHQASMAFCA